MTAVLPSDAPTGTTPAHLHPAYRTHVRLLRVTTAQMLTPRVRRLELADPTGAPLAGYEPGAHLVLTTRPGSAHSTRNAYSLTGDGFNPRTYSISVLRRDDGDGGSAWVHDALAVGDLVEVAGPRSTFAPRHDQRHALLVAGGIGVTPVLSHARALARWGGTAEVLYAHRPGHGAHLADLHDLPGITLRTAHSAAELTAVLTERVRDQPLGTHAYTCGPVGMIDAFLAIGRDAGWPEGRLHVERFTAPELDPGVPFVVRIGSTGARLPVPPGTSLLDALLAAGCAVSSLCRRGVCGECLVPVRSGDVDHRDLVLTAAQRAAGDRLASCVSRAAQAGGVVEVDL